MNEIQKHQQNIKNNILKGFTNLDEELKKAEQEELEKARSGRYADNAENRKLNRVGQEYGNPGKQKEQGGNKDPKKEEDSKDGSSGDTKLPDNKLDKHLADTPTPQLKKYAEKKDAKYHDEAVAELKKREGGSGKDGGDNGGGNKPWSEQNWSEETQEMFDHHGGDDVAKFLALEDEGAPAEEMKKVFRTSNDYKKAVKEHLSEGNPIGGDPEGFQSSWGNNEIAEMMSEQIKNIYGKDESEADLLKFLS